MLSAFISLKDANWIPNRPKLPWPRIDLVGKSFGCLTVVKLSLVRQNSRVLWDCSCLCGKFVAVRSDALKSGNTRSCGCQQTRLGEKSNLFKHGKYKTAEYLRESSGRYIAQKLGASFGQIPAEQIERRIEELGNECIYCGGPYEAIDHIEPLSRGGKHVLVNLAPSCTHCNSSKGNKILISEWMPQRPIEAVDRLFNSQLSPF